MGTGHILGYLDHMERDLVRDLAPFLRSNLRAVTSARIEVAISVRNEVATGTCRVPASRDLRLVEEPEHRGRLADELKPALQRLAEQSILFVQAAVAFEDVEQSAQLA